MKEKLKKLTELGISAAAIGRGIGCGRATVTNWINGGKNISEENEWKLKAWLEDFKRKIAEI